MAVSNNLMMPVAAIVLKTPLPSNRAGSIFLKRYFRKAIGKTIISLGIGIKAV